MIAAGPPRRDRRWLALAITVLATGAGGLWLQGAAPRTAPEAPSPPPAAAAKGSLQQPFDDAVSLLIAGRHAQAVAALHRVLALAPRLPEAHVNLGYALLGLHRPRAARAAFDTAIDLAPDQANAYYGLALTWEAEGDLAMATGAMRSYLHLARDQRPEHLRRARAALWEWEAAQAAAPGASMPAR